MLKLPKNLRGFTLIELLIVIAVLGILALGLLSAINPLEQIKKAQDSTKRTDASELITAYDRYFATFQASPWGATAPSGTAMSGTNAGITELIAKNELKSQFASRTTLPSLFATLDSTTNLLTVCFAPNAAANKAGATLTSSGAAGCNASTTTTCYVCLPGGTTAPAATATATPIPTPTTGP